MESNPPTMKVTKTLSVRKLLEEYVKNYYSVGVYIVYYPEWALNLNEDPWIDDKAIGIIFFQDVEELKLSLGFWWSEEDGLYVRLKAKFLEENNIENRPHNLLCFIDGKAQVIEYNPHNNGIEFETNLNNDEQYFV
jgi:hypothetical protein